MDTQIDFIIYDIMYLRLYILYYFLKPYISGKNYRH